MRKLILPLAAIVALGYGVRFANAADDDKKPSGKEEKITGVLIDEKCAAKFSGKENPEEAAKGHPASCVASCAKKSPLLLLHGKDELKLDKKGEDLAKEYLEKKDAKTRVTITGVKEGDEIKVSSIDAASEEK